MVGEEILIEIDTTLDRLIRNAEAIQNVALEDLSETELEGFQKTQESLLQHLLTMDQMFEQKPSVVPVPDRRAARFKIQDKLLKFDRLKKGYSQTIAESLTQKSCVLSKRKAKRWL